MGVQGGQKNREAACIIWLDKPFFLLERRPFVTIITACLRQVDCRLGGTHENLEDCSVVILSVITALLLWRRKLVGYLLAGALLVFSILTGTAILVIFLAMSSKGMPTSIGVEALIAAIVVVSLVLSMLFLREVK